MEKAFWIGLVLAIVIAIALVLIRLAARWRARMHASWAAVAARLDGTFVPAKGSWWETKVSRVEAKIGAATVRLDHFTVHHGKHTTVYTRTRVATSCSKRLTSYRESFFSGIGKALGMQDLLVGDPVYDDCFVIKSDDEAWARSVLHELLRKEHLDAPKLTLNVRDGWIETLQVGFDLDVDSLERRMRLTAALAVAVAAHA